MDDMRRIFFVLLVICLAAGYFIADLLLRNRSGGRSRSGEQRGPRGDGRAKAYRPSETEPDREHRCAEILQIPLGAEPETLKRQYKELLSKYHPDKVQHLGPEFREMAEKKTREILEAYEFLAGRAAGK